MTSSSSRIEPWTRTRTGAAVPPLRDVASAQEEWRTKGNRRHPRGRACLWIKLSCGHCVQRMVRLSKDGTATAPSRARCDECPPRPPRGGIRVEEVE